MFVATETGVFYSQLNKPEAFDLLNFESVNQADGQKIRGIHSDHEILIIFKERSTYALYGDDPNTWQIRLIDGELGCQSHRTILSSHGYVWWWSNSGVARWNLSEAIDRVGLRSYGNPADSVNIPEILRASAASSSSESRVVFSLPGVGASRATFLLPFNVKSDAFEATLWDPMDAASLHQGIDTSGPQIFLGGYAGQLFKLWSSNNDGVPSGTTNGTFVSTTPTISSITDAGAAFLNTGGKLIERRVTIIDQNGIPNSIRPKITANDATSLTLDVAVTVTPFLTYTYVIGGPNFQWDTGWRDFNDPWNKKRYEFLYVLLKGASFDTSTRGQMFFDYSESDPKTQIFIGGGTGGGALWDGGVWDESVWDQAGDIDERLRVARVGRSYRTRIINAAVNAPFALLLLACQGVIETGKN